MSDKFLPVTVNDSDSVPSIRLEDDGGQGLALAVAATLAEGNENIGQVGGHTIRPSATFTRPANTDAYAVGDLIANDVDAVDVVPMSWSVSRAAGLGGMIRRARLRKTTATTTSANFRLHLYSSAPTVTNGDNGAWQSNNAANYIGAIDINSATAFSDGAGGNGMPNIGMEINFTSDTVYGLLEARAAYAPGNAESFTISLEVLQN